MLIPYNTDAPIYHWPIATVGLIVLNTMLFWETDRTVRDWRLPEADHLRLIIAFHRAGQDRESIPLMTRYLCDHAGRATPNGTYFERQGASRR
ncbi:MAG: hypothetical protein IID44_12875 [Planctomycetes bacterium]|nr:hypothetical protein [Planctomycetota bacterium]